MSNQYPKSRGADRLLFIGYEINQENMEFSNLCSCWAVEEHLLYWENISSCNSAKLDAILCVYFLNLFCCGLLDMTFFIRFRSNALWDLHNFNKHNLFKVTRKQKFDSIINWEYCKGIKIVKKTELFDWHLPWNKILLLWLLWAFFFLHQ